MCQRPGRAELVRRGRGRSRQAGAIVATQAHGVLHLRYAPAAIWTGTALAVLVLSLGLPAATATTTAAAVALVVLHLVVGAAVIPALAATSRRHAR